MGNLEIDVLEVMDPHPSSNNALPLSGVGRPNHKPGIIQRGRFVRRLSQGDQLLTHNIFQIFRRNRELPDPAAFSQGLELLAI